MLSSFRSSVRTLNSTAAKVATRRNAATSTQKRAGDISDAFVSLSGQAFKPLPPKYADLKLQLLKGNEQAIRDSWERLLAHLRQEVPVIKELGSRIVPEIAYQDIDNPSEHFRAELKKRGVAIIRGVVSEEQALQWKADLRAYIKANPHTKAFPKDDPQVFELYWSPSQIAARAHPNLLNAQKFLMSFWHSKDSNAPLSTQHPTAYADRLRIRLPGDAQFALGPHVDGGSVERWEKGGYGLGGVYDAIWQGRWEDFDSWEASCRLPVKSDLYDGVGACSMFRMFQGWMSMSNTGPGEGTLLVNPLFKAATAYYMLRPFFEPKKSVDSAGSSFLDSVNWRLEDNVTTLMQGATPGHGQELSDALHPHLDLDQTMVHVPHVKPGDYVAWHCDTIHSVDKVHNGAGDSSVMYIPACPLTEDNAKFLARQRSCFIDGTPCPDFGGGEGESKHVGRPDPKDVASDGETEGLRAFGLQEWDSTAPGWNAGQREVMNRANKVLGFYS